MVKDWFGAMVKKTFTPQQCMSNADRVNATLSAALFRK
jgi:hypothetical protein